MLTLAVPAARIAAEIGPSSRRVIPEELWIGLGALLLLATLGTLAAVCNGVRLRRQHAQLVRLREAARTDALAGLLNRRGFIEEAERELARAQRHDRPFTLAYTDVRGLKGVNDTLGHQAGDRLLQAVSWLLRESARAGDTVGRLGGDELGLPLVEQGPEGAASVHRRIQELVDARRHTLWARIGVGRDDRPGDVPRRWNDGARTARACRSPALRSARDHGRAGLRG
ncbi:MAG TPA: GGDEF domain-containing protein [Solirubrobacteraceae bacterium]|nr:GGDEF domain-containing protein [Solirubrobacteraceae bacterium]